MHSNSEIEVEPYEEVVGNLNYSTPLNSRSSSPLTVAKTITDQTAFQWLIPLDGRGRTAEATETFDAAPLSAVRF